MVSILIRHYAILMRFFFTLDYIGLTQKIHDSCSRFVSFEPYPTK